MGTVGVRVSGPRPFLDRKSRGWGRRTCVQGGKVQCPVVISTLPHSPEARDHQDHGTAHRGRQQWRLRGLRVSPRGWRALRRVWEGHVPLLTWVCPPGKSVTPASPPLSQKLWATWSKAWTSTDFTSRTVSGEWGAGQGGQQRGVHHTRVHKRRACGWHPCQPLVPTPAVHSAGQEQQADPHDHPEPPRARHWRGRSLHRLHPPHAVHRRPGPASNQPVRGDTGVAPPRGQVAECALPLLRGARGPAAVR